MKKAPKTVKKGENMGKIMVGETYAFQGGGGKNYGFTFYIPLGPVE